jgi:hypothetical protein
MKAKAILITLLLSLSAVSLWAQEKYDYAVVRLTVTMSAKIVVATNSGVSETITEKGDASLVALIKKVEELSQAGWEVYSNSEVINNSFNGTTYYLRKKKN